MTYSPTAALPPSYDGVGASVRLGFAARGGERATGDRKPSLSLKATPPVGFSPLRVRVAADVRGGADDYADFYCPTIEWDWGDGTVSENSEDCDPYEAGKSTIRRRLGVEHIYRHPGGFKVSFRLKQKNETGGVEHGQRPGARWAGQSE